MRQLIFIIFIFNSLFVSSQNFRQIEGSYRFDYYKSDGHDGCCGQKIELNFNKSGIFEYYCNNDEGDYNYYMYSTGIYYFKKDTINLITLIPDSLYSYLFLPKHSISNELKVHITNSLTNHVELSFIEIDSNFNRINTYPIKHSNKDSLTYSIVLKSTTEFIIINYRDECYTFKKNTLLKNDVSIDLKKRKFRPLINIKKHIQVEKHYEERQLIFEDLSLMKLVYKKDKLKQINYLNGPSTRKIRKTYIMKK